MNPQEHEQAVISYIKNQEDFNNLLKLGITTETFTFYKEIFEFISQYQSKYGDVPKKDLIEKEPTGKNEYIGSKTYFVMSILKKAGFENKWFDLSKYEPTD